MRRRDIFVEWLTETQAIQEANTVEPKPMKYLFITLQPHYNTVVYSTNSVITRLKLGSHCLPMLPMDNSLITTVFCYNTDYTMDPKNSVIKEVPV